MSQRLGFFFEEGWIPSCQLTTFHVGDEANRISCGRLQADSVQGSGNDLSSRASLALLARYAAGLCSPGIFKPSAAGWCQGPVRVAKSLWWGRCGLEAALGGLLAVLGCVEMWCFRWHKATACPPASVTLRSHPAPCMERIHAAWPGHGARQFSL